MRPMRARSVLAAMKPSAVWPSSIGASGGPPPRIWKKWSMTQIESKPTSSAVRATRASVGPMAAAPPGQVKLLIWRPNFISTSPACRHSSVPAPGWYAVCFPTSSMPTTPSPTTRNRARRLMQVSALALWSAVIIVALAVIGLTLFESQDDPAASAPPSIVVGTPGGVAVANPTPGPLATPAPEATPVATQRPTPEPTPAPTPAPATPQPTAAATATPATPSRRRLLRPRWWWRPGTPRTQSQPSTATSRRGVSMPRMAYGASG